MKHIDPFVSPEKRLLPVLAFFLLFIFCGNKLLAQTPVNGYARITSVAGATINVSNVNETYDSFEDGEYVIVMQMQDNVIGGNTGNNVSFGNLSAIQSAGLYEVALIASHTESAGLPVTVTFASALSNTYNTGANSRVQLISYPTLGSPNYSTSFTISAINWNGTIGGVVAFLVNGTLTLNHNITASGAGFRGGSKNTPNSYTSCDATTYRTTTAARYAGKGEGIYLSTTAAHSGARAKILNGGGGGNDVNAGGGGGGNYSSGGDGGVGWVPAGTGCSPGVGGIGGLSLSAQIGVARVFMGGGGGGGHENDGVGTPGGAGGGIILIRANSIVSTGSCAGRSISADGSAAADAVNDGSGGGGAGGSVVMQVQSYSITGTCPLTFSASGGNGGSSVTSGAHGGGGGGGQGVVFFSGSQPTTNVTTTTNVGNGGSSCIGCTPAQNAISGTGPANTGIFAGASGPLPVELLSFTGKLNGNRVDLDWITATEINCDYFILERAIAGMGTRDIGQVDGNGNSVIERSYAFTDMNPEAGMNYYRLRQVDFNGTLSYSSWVAVEFNPAENYVSIYPNPSNGMVNIVLTGYKDQEVNISITDISGRRVQELSQSVNNPEFRTSFDLEAEPAGMYFVTVSSPAKKEVLQLVIY